MSTQPPHPTRRGLLRAGIVGPLAAVALATGGVVGCEVADVAPDPPDRPAPPDPDAATVDEALAAELGLLTDYDLALAAAPALAARLRPLREEHALHASRLRALGGGGPAAAAAGPAASPLPRTGTPGSAGPEPGTGAAALLSAVLAAERAATALHARLAVAATPRTAPLLASLSAAEASHLVVLGLP